MMSKSRCNIQRNILTDYVFDLDNLTEIRESFIILREDISTLETICNDTIMIGGGEARITVKLVVGKTGDE